MSRTVFRYDDKLNVSGLNIKRLRMEKQWSQRYLADRMQEYKLEVTKNAIQAIEEGSRTVKDLELLVLSKILEADFDEFFKGLEINLTEKTDISIHSEKSTYSENSDGYGIKTVAEKPSD